MKRLKQGLFWGAVMGVLLGATFWLTSCASPPQRQLYSAVQAPAVTLDTAMHAWGDYVAQFNPGADSERRVLSAYRKVKAAELLAIDAAHAAADQVGSTNSLPATVWQAAQSPEAAAALADLLALLRQLGLRI